MLYQNSLNDLSLAKDLDKNNMDIVVEECEIYTILKEYDIAFNKCKKANSYAKNNAVVYYAYGLNFFIKDDFKSAITYFQKSIKVEESLIGVYMLALSKEALQKDDEAILLYTQALELKSLEKYSTSLEAFENEIKNSSSIEESLKKIKTKISSNAYEK
jgi:tetratricopeptide (TPR) repeat protein